MTKPMGKKDDISESLASFVSEQLSLSKFGGSQVEIEMETDLAKDLGLDSLETMDLIAAVEEQFKVKIDASELGALKKFSDLVELVSGKQKS